MQKLTKLVFLYAITCTLYTVASDSIAWHIVKAGEADHDNRNNALLSYCRPYAQSCIEQYDSRCRETTHRRDALLSCCRPCAKSFIKRYDARFPMATIIAGLYTSMFYVGGWSLIEPHIASESIQTCLCISGYACIPCWACIVPCSNKYIAQGIIRCFDLNPASLNRHVSPSERMNLGFF